MKQTIRINIYPENGNDKYYCSIVGEAPEIEYSQQIKNIVAQNIIKAKTML